MKELFEKILKLTEAIFELKLEYERLKSENERLKIELKYEREMNQRKSGNINHEQSEPNKHDDTFSPF